MKINDENQCSVLFNGSTGIGWSLLTPTLLKIFLRRIMCEALDDDEGSVSTGGRQIPSDEYRD